MKLTLSFVVIMGMTLPASAQEGCPDAALEEGARSFFMSESGATYCTEDATSARWECFGDGARTWTVRRTLRIPGAHTWRSVEPSQADVWAFDCNWSANAPPCTLVECGD